MRPLLYLYLKSVVNGVKRSFSSPARTIGVLFFILSQLWWIPRVMFSPRAVSSLPLGFPKLPFPPVAVVDAVVFAVFAAFSALSMLTLLGYSGTYRTADVDVLFPTPVSPRTVLVFRVVRDIWIQTVMPLFFAVFFWRPVQAGWTNLFSGVEHPESANTVFRVGMIAYFLSAIAFVWLGHGLSLALAKPDDRTDRIRTVASWLTAGTVLGVVTVLNVQGRHTVLPDGLVSMAHQPWLRGMFFVASAATSVTMSAFTGSALQAVSGLLVLVGVMAFGAALACRNTTWMYEQAALKAQVTEGIRAAARSGGGMFAMASLRAQSGKVKAGKWGWFQRLTVRGPLALLWKEAIVFKRSGLWTFVLNVVLGIAMAVVAVTVADSVPWAAGLTLLLLQAAVLIGPALGQSQAGFIESLRRIDLLKPLPFSSLMVVLVEIVAKAAPPIMASMSGLVLVPIVRSSMLPAAAAGLIVFPPMTLSLSAVSLLFVVLLPDLEDPTQRGFRGLATMLGMLIVCGPTILVFAVLVSLGLPLFVAALPAALLSLAATVLVSWLAGRVYETFNPSE